MNSLPQNLFIFCNAVTRNALRRMLPRRFQRILVYIMYYITRSTDTRFALWRRTLRMEHNLRNTHTHPKTKIHSGKIIHRVLLIYCWAFIFRGALPLNRSKNLEKCRTRKLVRLMVEPIPIVLSIENQICNVCF